MFRFAFLDDFSDDKLPRHMLCRQHTAMPAAQEMAMKDFLESGTAWITDHARDLGADFDPEILSLPGGSLIAALLWFYGRIRRQCA
jgi:hypothetical protein